MAKNKALGKRKNTSKDIPKRTNHLLVIGIDKYAREIGSLNNAVKDAKAFREVLLERFQFEEEHITTLFDEEATRINILNTFRDLLDRLTELDNLVFYYSGHGELLELGKGKQGYWIPTDAIFNEIATYISNNDIVNLFRYSNAHHIFGIVDSCFSGGLFQTRKVQTWEERFNSIPSRWLLTAGREELVSDGSLGTNSPFAAALLTYLRNLSDNAIGVAKLCELVLTGMDYNTEEQTPRGEPLQNVGHYGGQFVFYRKGYLPSEEKAPSAKTATRNIEEDSTTKKTTRGVQTSPPFPSDEASLESANTVIAEAISNVPKLDNFQEVQSYLQELIPQDMGKALDAYKAIIAKNNDVILQLSRYNGNNNQFNKHIISLEQYNRVNAQIGYALTSMIEDLKESDLQADYLSSIKTFAKRNKPSTPLSSNLPSSISTANTTNLEKKGLQQQLELLTEKINFFRNKLIIETDAGRQFAYEKQIAEMETELAEIKRKLNS